MSRSQVLSNVDFLEEAFLRRDGAPSPKSLRKWRREVHEEAAFTLVAGDGVFATGDVRDRAIAALLEANEALAAGAVIFRIPNQHAPTQENRDRFRDLCEELSGEALGSATRVLWPRGLWELSLGTRLAAELDLLLCFDPLSNDPLEEVPALLAQVLETQMGYLRVDRVGTPRRRLDPYELETLAEIAAELSGGWISFAHGERVRDAVALRKLLTS